MSSVFASTGNLSGAQTSDNTNLALIPSFWSYSSTSTTWCINSFDYATSQSIVYPYTENGQTAIELNPNPSVMATSSAIVCGAIYELDGQVTPINPGDQVIYNVWLMNDAPTAYEGSYGGTRVGLDMWASFTGPRICEITTPDGETTYPNYPASRSQCIIPFGTTTITEISISFTVQYQYEADPWGGYAAGTMVTPAYIVPWILGISSHPSSETARTWIFATELEINSPGTPTPPPSTPTPAPTPTPTPLPTPTPTPTPAPTPTPTSTPAPTPSTTPTPTPTATPIPTPTPSASPPPKATPTLTPIPTYILTVPPTIVTTAPSTASPTSTPKPTPTPTPKPTPASTPEPTPTLTPALIPRIPQSNAMGRIAVLLRIGEFLSCTII